jgi:hypothetical protein
MTHVPRVEIIDEDGKHKDIGPEIYESTKTLCDALTHTVAEYLGPEAPSSLTEVVIKMMAVVSALATLMSSNSDKLAWAEMVSPNTANRARTALVDLVGRHQFDIMSSASGSPFRELPSITEGDRLVLSDDETESPIQAGLIDKSLLN